MLADTLSDFNAALRDSVNHYTSFKNIIYPKEMIDRVNKCLDELEKIREELDNSDIETIK
jgi:hypothetical protein